MSNPEIAHRIEWRDTPHRDRGRNGGRPRLIVLHTTAGHFAGTIDWFSRPESGVSAHYLVGLDGRVAQFVEEADTAHHVGRVLHPTARLSDVEQGNPNLHTIGIEFEDGGDPGGAARTDAQYLTGAALIEGIAARWRIPLDREHVVGHREVFAAKECPGNLDIERLIAGAQAARDRGGAAASGSGACP